MKHYVIYLHDSLHSVTIWADELVRSEYSGSLLFLHKGEVISVFSCSDVEKVFIYEEGRGIFDPDESECVFSA